MVSISINTIEFITTGRRIKKKLGMDDGWEIVNMDTVLLDDENIWIANNEMH